MGELTWTVTPLLFTSKGVGSRKYGVGVPESKLKVAVVGGCAVGVGVGVEGEGVAVGAAVGADVGVGVEVSIVDGEFVGDGEAVV